MSSLHELVNVLHTRQSASSGKLLDGHRAVSRLRQLWPFRSQRYLLTCTAFSADLEQFSQLRASWKRLTPPA